MSMGGVVGIIDWLGRLLREGLKLGIGILEGIPLFWDVAPVRDIDWGDEGCFGVGFERVGGIGEGW